MDRKEMIKILGEYLGVTPKYLGVPSFAYQIKTNEETYIIDRHGIITTLEGNEITLDEILNSRQTEEELAIEDKTEPEVKTENSEVIPIDVFELTLPMEGHTGTTLQNIVNMIFSKQHLIKMAFEIKEPLMDETFAEELSNKEIRTLENFKTALYEIGPERCQGVTFDFEKETVVFNLIAEVLTPEKVAAFKDLAVLINKNAKAQIRTSYKQAQEDNPKYAFRTWVIRLGMNGSEYKKTRKVLLSNLEGSGAFRKISEEREEQVDG